MVTLPWIVRRTVCLSLTLANLSTSLQEASETELDQALLELERSLVALVPDALTPKLESAFADKLAALSTLTPAHSQLEVRHETHPQMTLS